MISIIQNISLPSSINLEEIQKNAEFILKRLNRPNDEISILFVNNEEIQKINSKYALKDKPTDVLSFSNNDIDPETGNLYLGDIVISFEKVKTQAKEKSHSLTVELCTLIIHGILHLLDYDHADPDDAAIMFKKQDELLLEIIGD